MLYIGKKCGSDRLEIWYKSNVLTALKKPQISFFAHYCKSLLCSVFHEQTCTRFTHFLFSRSSPCPKYLINPYNAIFLKSQGSKDIKNDILDCQIHKYTNTNTQIHKYTNTAYDKMTEIPNICYIFEQLVVQGCQK